MCPCQSIGPSIFLFLSVFQAYGPRVPWFIPSNRLFLGVLLGFLPTGWCSTALKAVVLFLYIAYPNHQYSRSVQITVILAVGLISRTSDFGICSSPAAIQLVNFHFHVALRKQVYLLTHLGNMFRTIQWKKYARCVALLTWEFTRLLPIVDR